MGRWPVNILYLRTWRFCWGTRASRSSLHSRCSSNIERAVFLNSALATLAFPNTARPILLNRLLPRPEPLVYAALPLACARASRKNHQLPEGYAGYLQYYLAQVSRSLEPEEKRAQKKARGLFLHLLLILRAPHYLQNRPQGIWGGGGGGVGNRTFS